MLRAALVVLVVLTLSACTTVRRSFPGRTPEQVWTAMVAVAETPNYDDPDPARRWFVKENHVWADEANARIEIFRQLDRIRHRTATKPRRESREWRFQIVMEGRTPPIVGFTSRGFGVPMQADEEGERFFADVAAVLTTGVLPEPTPASRPAEPATQPVGQPVGGSIPPPAADDVPPIVDVDDLEPE